MEQHQERILTLAEATAVLPRVHGKKLHTSTVWRWIRVGVRGVRLEALRLGGRYCVTEAALRRFGKELAARELQPKTRIVTPKTATNKQRTRSIERAEKTLREGGIV